MTPEQDPRSTLPLERELLSLSYVGQVTAVAVLYIVAARAGLTLDAVSGFASLIWAPTGIALAALLLAGRRIWPGVFVGALVANVLTGAPTLVAAGIATGNTLEAVVAVYALTRVPDFQLTLDRVRDVLALIVLAAGLATIISPTIGVASLFLAGLVAPHNLAETWLTWWVGDAIGALLIAPLILVWATRRRPRLFPRRSLEAVVLLLILVTAGLLMFVVKVPSAGGTFEHAYVFFPLLMWATIRFGQRGAVTATIVVSGFAVMGTVIGHGPFAEPSLHSSLFALQTFLGITGATFLVLGASISERERSKQELSEARDVATAANRAKADFLAVMSHELRTPLNAISGYAQLLALGVSGPLTPKQSEAVERIRGNQLHLLTLIDDVLSFAKIEAGSSALNVQAVRVCETIDSIDAVLRPDLSRQQLTFVWDGCDSTLEVRADQTKLRQILLNVVGNAVKFTPPNGRIVISAARAGDNVRIRVADSGIGIPSDKLDRIFEPFYQVDSRRTREFSGVGLGLAISRDFARAMGGDMTVESEPGNGCTVTISLPIVASPLDIDPISLRSSESR